MTTIEGFIDREVSNLPTPEEAAKEAVSKIMLVINNKSLYCDSKILLITSLSNVSHTHAWATMECPNCKDIREGTIQWTYRKDNVIKRKCWGSIYKDG